MTGKTLEDTMDELSTEERTAWIQEASEALRDQMMRLRDGRVDDAYERLAVTDEWREETPAEMLREARVALAKAEERETPTR